jgi:hypothetical protein
MLPPGISSPSRLTTGSGWSFHVNTRPDYEQSLLDAPPGGPAHGVDLERVYRRAEPASRVAFGWESAAGAIPREESGGPGLLWRFIDPDDFSAPGVRLHAVRLSSDGGPP